MSHHYSGPDFTCPHDDARLDFCDLFAFPKPEDSSRSILIIDTHPSVSVNPEGPTTAEPFAPEAIYELKIDTDRDAVATVVESLALSRPEVGFFLRSDWRRSLALPEATDLRERISQVHGLSLARSLVALEDPVVWGFVSPLAVSFPTRRYLHVAVNGRVVEADSFAPAVAKAYADLLPKGRHPAAFLRLELGPGEVDVNVHPAKSAVRLRAGRSAYPLVVGTIRSALAPEREMGGAAAPEEGDHELTLIGQFAGRSEGASSRSHSYFSVSSGLQSLRCGRQKNP